MRASNTNVTSQEGCSIEKRCLIGRGRLLDHLWYWWPVRQKSKKNGVITIFLRKLDSSFNGSWALFQI